MLHISPKSLFNIKIIEHIHAANNLSGEWKRHKGGEVSLHIFSEGVYISRVKEKKEVKESENIPVAEFHNFL